MQIHQVEHTESEPEKQLAIQPAPIVLLLFCRFLCKSFVDLTAEDLDICVLAFNECFCAIKLNKTKDRIHKNRKCEARLLVLIIISIFIFPIEFFFNSTDITHITSFHNQRLHLKIVSTYEYHVCSELR